MLIPQLTGNNQLGDGGETHLTTFLVLKGVQGQCPSLRHNMCLHDVTMPQSTGQLQTILVKQGSVGVFIISLCLIPSNYV